MIYTWGVVDFAGVSGERRMSMTCIDLGIENPQWRRTYYLSNCTGKSA